MKRAHDAHGPLFAFEAAEAAAADGEALVIDLDGFEGPLHVLLALARAQKVDLLELSIAKLADQYAAFVRDAGRRRFSLAADYLVMASWLAFLKSRLMLPRTERPTEEIPAEALAAGLAFRLAKLDAMRRAAEALQSRPLLGRDVFPRGERQQTVVVSDAPLQGDAAALALALVARKLRAAPRRYTPPAPVALPLEEARERLREMLPRLTAWSSLRGVAPATVPGGASRASCLASTLSASLELVREGTLEARQSAPYADLLLRRAPSHAAAVEAAA